MLNIILLSLFKKYISQYYPAKEENISLDLNGDENN